MIDLHSHILPGLCDGSQSLETSLEMARIAVAEGTTHLACTPHVYPSVFDNSSTNIQIAMLDLQQELHAQNIPLQLVIGADVHMVYEVLERLQNKEIPTLNHSRYFLLEPAHHVPVANFVRQIERFVAHGYVPVITHPERLSWVKDYYPDFIKAVHRGAWLQITADAFTGKFGRDAKYWAERFLLDGYVHILASDAHGVSSRPPVLAEAVIMVEHLLGDELEAQRTVLDRPRAILNNTAPERVIPPPAFVTSTIVRAKPTPLPWYRRFF